MRTLLLASLCAVTACTSFPEAGRYACDSSHPDPRDCGGAPGVWHRRRLVPGARRASR